MVKAGAPLSTVAEGFEGSVRSMTDFQQTIAYKFSTGKVNASAWADHVSDMG